MSPPYEKIKLEMGENPHEDIATRGNWNLLGPKFGETVKQWDKMWPHMASRGLSFASQSRSHFQI